jgi:hypothetical protein
MLASGFSKDFSKLRLAYGCLSQHLGFLFAIQKHLTKDLNFWLAGVFHQDFFKIKRQVWIFISIFV